MISLAPTALSPTAPLRLRCGHHGESPFAPSGHRTAKGIFGLPGFLLVVALLSFGTVACGKKTIELRAPILSALEHAYGDAMQLHGARRYADARARLDPFVDKADKYNRLARNDETKPEAIELADAYFLLSISAYLQGDEAAMARYSAKSRADARDPRGVAWRAFIDARDTDTKTAENSLKMVDETSSPDRARQAAPLIRLAQGWLAYRTNNLEQAGKLLDAALRAAQDIPELYTTDFIFEIEATRELLLFGRPALDCLTLCRSHRQCAELGAADCFQWCGGHMDIFMSLNSDTLRNLVGRCMNTNCQQFDGCLATVVDSANDNVSTAVRGQVIALCENACRMDYECHLIDKEEDRCTITCLNRYAHLNGQAWKGLLSCLKPNKGFSCVHQRACLDNFERMTRFRRP